MDKLKPAGAQQHTNKPQNQEQREFRKFRNSMRTFKRRVLREVHQPRFIVEVAALLGLAIYTCETRRTNNITETAIIQSRDQFSQDQRPYIWLTKDGTGAPEFLRNLKQPQSPIGQIIWAYHYTNYGKSPAFITSSSRFIKIGKADFVPSYEVGSHHVDGLPIPPGADYFNTVVSQPVVSVNYFSSLIDPTNPLSLDSITVRISFQYRDSGGRSYSTDICLKRLNGGAIAYCPGTIIR